MFNKKYRFFMKYISFALSAILCISSINPVFASDSVETTTQEAQDGNEKKIEEETKQKKSEEQENKEKTVIDKEKNSTTQSVTEKISEEKKETITPDRTSEKTQASSEKTAHDQDNVTGIKTTSVNKEDKEIEPKDQKIEDKENENFDEKQNSENNTDQNENKSTKEDVKDPDENPDNGQDGKKDPDKNPDNGQDDKKDPDKNPDSGQDDKKDPEDIFDYDITGPDKVIDHQEADVSIGIKSILLNETDGNVIIKVENNGTVSTLDDESETFTSKEFDIKAGEDLSEKEVNIHIKGEEGYASATTKIIVSVLDKEGNILSSKEKIVGFKNPTYDVNVKSDNTGLFVGDNFTDTIEINLKNKGTPQLTYTLSEPTSLSNMNISNNIFDSIIVVTADGEKEILASENINLTANDKISKIIFVAGKDISDERVLIQINGYTPDIDLFYSNVNFSFDMKDGPQKTEKVIGHSVKHENIQNSTLVSEKSLVEYNSENRIIFGGFTGLVKNKGTFEYNISLENNEKIESIQLPKVKDGIEFNVSITTKNGTCLSGTYRDGTIIRLNMDNISNITISSNIEKEIIETDSGKIVFFNNISTTSTITAFISVKSKLISEDREINGEQTSISYILGIDPDAIVVDPDPIEKPDDKPSIKPTEKPSNTTKPDDSKKNDKPSEIPPEDIIHPVLPGKPIDENKDVKDIQENIKGTAIAEIVEENVLIETIMESDIQSQIKDAEKSAIASVVTSNTSKVSKKDTNTKDVLDKAKYNITPISEEIVQNHFYNNN